MTHSPENPPQNYEQLARFLKPRLKSHEEAIEGIIAAMTPLASETGENLERYRIYISIAQEGRKNIRRLSRWLNPDYEDLDLMAWPLRNILELCACLELLEKSKLTLVEFSAYATSGMAKAYDDLIKGFQSKPGKSMALAGLLETALDSFKSHSIQNGYKGDFNKPRWPTLGEWVNKEGYLDPLYKVAYESFHCVASQLIHPSPLQLARPVERTMDTIRLNFLVRGMDFVTSLTDSLEIVVKKIAAGTHLKGDMPKA